MLHDVELTVQYVSPQGDGRSYVYYADPGERLTLQITWDQYVEAGKPNMVTVNVVTGAGVAAGTYSTA